VRERDYGPVPADARTAGAVPGVLPTWAAGCKRLTSFAPDENLEGRMGCLSCAALALLCLRGMLASHPVVLAVTSLLSVTLLGMSDQ
jgi:hypothetical protein